MNSMAYAPARESRLLATLASNAFTGPQSPLCIHPGVVTAFGVAAGAAVVLLTLTIESLGYESKQFDGPLTCNHVPNDCWDAFAKTNGIRCPKMFQDTVIRGHLIPAGQATCYKAVYWNVDKATMQLICWLLLWAMLVLRAYERLVRCTFTRNLRVGPAVALLAGQITLWCGSDSACKSAHACNTALLPLHNSNGLQ